MARARGMNGARWRELKGIQPIERTRRAMHPSRRAQERGHGAPKAKHTRTSLRRAPIGIARARRHQRRPDGQTWRMVWEPSPDVAITHTTKRDPWAAKADRRRRNRNAKRSRRANR